jgi:hypothetical protein
MPFIEGVEVRAEQAGQAPRQKKRDTDHSKRSKNSLPRRRKQEPGERG